MQPIRHFINILDYDRPTLAGLIEKSIADKKRLAAGPLDPCLARRSVAIYMEKPSLRTRVSFELAVVQLGGYPVILNHAEIGLGAREPVKDVARVISRMCDGFVARTFSHEALEEFARYASVPVVNALTDYSHPCQAMADLLTVRERFGSLQGLKLAYVGDGNNVARSLAALCARLGVAFAIAAPQGFQLEDEFVRSLSQRAPNAAFEQSDDPRRAADGAHVLYTDTWVSMGQEKDRERKVQAFKGFQLTADLLRSAADNAVVMHCLPAYRGMEITDELMESPQSVVFDQAENRLHFQRTLLAALIGGEQID